jgi:hypothetical protein
MESSPATEPWQANALTMPPTIHLSLSDIVSVTIRLALVHSKGPQGMVGYPFPCLVPTIAEARVMIRRRDEA